MLRVPYPRRGVTFPPTFTDAAGCGADLGSRGEKPVGVCVCPYHRYKIKSGIFSRFLSLILSFSYSYCRRVYSRIRPRARGGSPQSRRSRRRAFSPPKRKARWLRSPSRISSIGRNRARAPASFGLIRGVAVLNRVLYCLSPYC